MQKADSGVYLEERLAAVGKRKKKVNCRKMSQTKVNNESSVRNVGFRMNWRHFALLFILHALFQTSERKLNFFFKETISSLKNKNSEKAELGSSRITELLRKFPVVFCFFKLSFLHLGLHLWAIHEFTFLYMVVI